MRLIQKQCVDVKVIKRDRIYATVRSIWKEHEDVMGEEEVNALFGLLQPLTDVDEAVKRAHVQSINEKNSREKTKTVEVNQDRDDVKICPRCGNQLVIRTARRGRNNGQRFYGCSGYPSCRYVENID